MRMKGTVTVSPLAGSYASSNAGHEEVTLLVHSLVALDAHRTAES
jgi:hypothetical protein